MQGGYLPAPADKVAELKKYAIPETPISRDLLKRYIPKHDWFTAPERANDPHHGVDHLTRVLIMQEAITNMLIESGQLQSGQVDREALRWSAVAHDIRRTSDFDGRGHADAAANWVLQMLPADISQETRIKIYLIIKAHDKEIDPKSDIATEPAILKDADALDRERLSRKIPYVIPRVLRNKVALDPTQLRFDVSLKLIPCAKELYRISTDNGLQQEGNPGNAVLDAATHMQLLTTQV